MQAVLSNARRLSRVLRPSSLVLNSDHRLLLSPDIKILSSHHHHQHQQCPYNNTSSSCSICFSGNRGQSSNHMLHSMMKSKASFSSTTTSVEGTPTETVKELYDKMLESVKRLSNLRIHDNFNCNLCREVAKTCVRVGALDFAKRALWKHNVYGLTPSIASAHHILSYAKDHKDAKLMVEVMKLLKKNGLPLQPGTADIVFRICYDTDDWELISKFAKWFVMAGVNLRGTTFETWMEFAAKIGDTKSLWKIEKLRSESMKQHSLRTGFSCSKGFLLDREPEKAAAVIQILNQTLSDAKKPGIMDELQKLINEWPFDVIKRQKPEDKKALATGLKSDILAMVTALSSEGLKVNVNLDDLASEGVLS